MCFSLCLVIMNRFLLVNTFDLDLTVIYSVHRILGRRTMNISKESQH
jgi:hypothetical protein